MEPATVDAAFVIPVQLAITAVSILGIVTFGYLVKDGVVCLHKRGKDAINESAATCGCISHIHSFAAMNYIFFCVTALDGLFVSNWLLGGSEQNCAAFALVGAVGWTGSKASQYGFYISRMKSVFEGTRWKVPDRYVSRLVVTAVVFVVSSLTAGIFNVSSANPSHPAGPSTTNPLAAGKYSVCISFNQEFSAVSVWGGLTFIICDSVIMFSIAYLFIRRLIMISRPAPDEFQQNEENEPHILTDLVDVRQAAFYFACFACVAGISTYITVALVNSHPDNLSPTLITLLDVFINMGMVAMSLKEWMKLEWLLARKGEWSGQDQLMGSDYDDNRVMSTTRSEREMNAIVES